jgi:spore coat protein CotH
VKPNRTSRLVAAAYFFLCSLPASTANASSEAGAAFFTNPAVHRFEVEISPENVQALRLAPRTYVPATVRVNGETFTNVGVHLKGVATFRPIDDQPSLTLNMAKFDKQKRFHGLRKIHLNNGKEDPTFLCEAISAEMYARAGLPVARVALAQTRLNGRNLGPYVAIEGFTEEFLGRYFRNVKGNLYDSGFRRDITEPLEKLLGKKPHDWSDLKRLASAASIVNREERWQRLAEALDTNQFAAYLSMQVLTWNWDGYAMFQNNYRVYHEPDSGRIYFFPHGMDQMFSRPTAPLMPRWNSLVARAFMETAPGREIYKRQLGLLYTNAYDSAAFARRVDELSGRIRPIIAQQSQRAALDYDRRVAELRQRIIIRGEFVRQQLATNWADALPRR